jgi:hypothetical protein
LSLNNRVCWCNSWFLLGLKLGLLQLILLLLILLRVSLSSISFLALLDGCRVYFIGWLDVFLFEYLLVLFRRASILNSIILIPRLLLFVEFEEVFLLGLGSRGILTINLMRTLFIRLYSCEDFIILILIKSTLTLFIEEIIVILVLILHLLILILSLRFIRASTQS